MAIDITQVTSLPVFALIILLVTMVNSQIAVGPRIYGIAALSATLNHVTPRLSSRGVHGGSQNLFPFCHSNRRVVAEIRRRPHSGTYLTLGNATVQRQRGQHLQSMCGFLLPTPQMVLS